MDLSKLKRHRGAKDAAALESLVSSYRKQMLELQGQINQMTPNMRVSEPEAGGLFEGVGGSCQSRGLVSFVVHGLLVLTLR